MPLYEFACAKCAHTFEELVKSDENGTGVKCPACGHRGGRKLLSTFSGRMGQEKGRAAESGCPNGSCCFGNACGM